jgi:hypothetical protein
MKLLIAHKKRPAVSPVIATLLLIAIAVAAAIIVYAFVTGLIGGLSSSAGSNLVTVTSSLTVPGGSGAGLLVISIQNSANNPVTGIQVIYTSFEDATTNIVTCMGQTPAAAGVGCAAAILHITTCGSTSAPDATHSVPFCNAAGVAISSAAAAQLQVGGQTGASENVIGNGVVLSTGASYSLTVTVNFANGNTHSQAISVTAQI